MEHTESSSLVNGIFMKKVSLWDSVSLCGDYTIIVVM